MKHVNSPHARERKQGLHHPFWISTPITQRAPCGPHCTKAPLFPISIMVHFKHMSFCKTLAHSRYIIATMNYWLGWKNQEKNVQLYTICFISVSIQQNMHVLGIVFENSKPRGGLPKGQLLYVYTGKQSRQETLKSYNGPMIEILLWETIPHKWMFLFETLWSRC